MLEIRFHAAYNIPVSIRLLYYRVLNPTPTITDRSICTMIVHAVYLTVSVSGLVLWYLVDPGLLILSG